MRIMHSTITISWTSYKQSGQHPLLDEVQAVKEFPKQTTMRKLQEFLGLVNFYHCFLPNAAHILQPLHKVLGATKRGSVKLQWSIEATSAFIAAKEALASGTLLAYPKPNSLTSIMCNTSDMAVGAVLQQYIGIGGVQSPTFPSSSSPHEPNTARLIGNSWPSTCLSNTLDTSLKVDNFQSTPSINPSPTLS